MHDSFIIVDQDAAYQNRKSNVFVLFLIFVCDLGSNGRKKMWWEKMKLQRPNEKTTPSPPQSQLVPISTSKATLTASETILDSPETWLLFDHVR